MSRCPISFEEKRGRAVLNFKTKQWQNKNKNHRTTGKTKVRLYTSAENYDLIQRTLLWDMQCLSTDYVAPFNLSIWRGIIHYETPFITTSWKILKSYLPLLMLRKSVQNLNYQTSKWSHSVKLICGNCLTCPLKNYLTEMCFVWYSADNWIKIPNITWRKLLK